MGTSRKTMRSGIRWIGCVGAVALAFGSAAAWAQTTVSYGRITAVTRVNQQNAGAQGAGTIVGGALGASLGSGRSGSNRALGGIGGAVVGNNLARMASQQQAFQYTILIGGTRTITMVTDQAGKRVGDCVSVERGQFNNLRLADDSKCATTSGSAASLPPTQADLNAARACDQAKDQLLVAANDDAFDRAYRRVRLLCGD
jgi:outer membrane lipoprotein SlyB